MEILPLNSAFSTSILQQDRPPSSLPLKKALPQPRLPPLLRTRRQAACTRCAQNTAGGNRCSFTPLKPNKKIQNHPAAPALHPHRCSVSRQSPRARFSEAQRRRGTAEFPSPDAPKPRRASGQRGTARHSPGHTSAPPAPSRSGRSGGCGASEARSAAPCPPPGARPCRPAPPPGAGTKRPRGGPRHYASSRLR